MIRIGTAGWTREKGNFFDDAVPKKDGEKELQYYASHFSVTEINTTFYGVPKRETFEKWAAGSPEGFTFCVKVPQRITHEFKLKGVEDEISRLLDCASGLGKKMGPLLFQLPPTFTKDLHKLKEVVDMVPSTVRVAWDFRHASWFSDEVYSILRNAGHVCVAYNHPELPTRDTDAMMTLSPDWGYVRLHGLTLPLHQDSYPDKNLQEWADKIVHIHNLTGSPGKKREIFVLFQNDPHPENALTLIAQCRAMSGAAVAPAPGVFKAPPKITSFFKRKPEGEPQAAVKREALKSETHASAASQESASGAAPATVPASAAAAPVSKSSQESLGSPPKKKTKAEEPPPPPPANAKPISSFFKPAQPSKPKQKEEEEGEEIVID